MAAIAIGPVGWRNSTVKGIKLSQTIVEKSDKSCDIGKYLDPLPHLRDTVAQYSNDEAKRYTRDVRSVVAKLRESLLQTNEEIKSLTRSKEALEKLTEHTRKDLKMNQNSGELRGYRPPREKGHDGADDLLNAERAHLQNNKKILEAELKSVLQHLQTLDGARKKLFAIIQERSRVLDLLNNSVGTNSNTTDNGSENGSGHGSGRTSRDGRVMPGMESFQVGACSADGLGAYTPVASLALSNAADARARSAFLRRESSNLIDTIKNLQKSAHQAVNDGLTKKISETITLQQHLGLGLGENRHSIFRAQRWYDATDKARGYLLGPMMSADLTVRERLDRPIIRVFQRHAGTQLPEAQHLIRGGDGLLQSLTATSRNIGLLRMANQRLNEDIKSKSAGAEFDGKALRLRRSRADHRWTLGNAF